MSFCWFTTLKKSTTDLCTCFSFLVEDDGTVYEGRGWGVVGAHALGNNRDSVGIAFMGNFNGKFT